jgi:two-component system response regulator AlgR
MSALPRILIADDEPLARERIAALIEELGAGAIVAQAATGREALELAAQHAADVVLLDIRMPEMDGLEAARHLSRLPAPPAVIFTTAYADHALDAFEANAIAYLLKPIRRERLAASLARAVVLARGRLEQLGAALGGRRTRTHLSAVVGGRMRLVPVAEVRFLLAEQKYVTAAFPGGEIVMEDSLRSLEQEFEGTFMRIHRNALVAIAYVETLEKDAAGNWCIGMSGIGQRLAVSRRLLGAVRQHLKAASARR